MICLNLAAASDLWQRGMPEKEQNALFNTGLSTKRSAPSNLGPV